jgi:hypothetical protein
MKLTEAQIAHLFLAYQDGTLSATEKEQLDVCLLQNPELAFDLEDQPKLIAPNHQMNVHSLLRPSLEHLTIYEGEEAHPYEKLAIGALEGLLSDREKKIELQLAHDKLYKQFKNNIEQTQLVPNVQQVFPNHELLIKKAPVRRLYLKHYALVVSSAAAVFFAVLLIGQANNHDSLIQGKTRQHARLVPNKKSPIQDVIPNQNLNQVVAKQPEAFTLQQGVGQPPRDCIAEVQFPNLEQQPDIQIAQLSSSNAALPEETTPKQISSMNLAQSNPSAFQKEPITMKAFLLQKTNEKLFGTAAPSTGLKFETLARYASETVGIPVQYVVDEASEREKFVFQLGPITIEKTRTRK